MFPKKNENINCFNTCLTNDLKDNLKIYEDFDKKPIKPFLCRFC